MFARRGHKPSRKPPYQGHNRVADQVCDPGGGEPLAHSVSMPARLASGLHPSPSTSCTPHGSGDATSPLRGCTEWLSVAGNALLCHMMALPRSMPSGPSVSEEEPKCEFAPCRSPSGQPDRSEREIFSNTKQIQHSRVIWGLEPCSRARETCRQGCQVRANGAVHASHNRERDALCVVGHKRERVLG